MDIGTLQQVRAELVERRNQAIQLADQIEAEALELPALRSRLATNHRELLGQSHALTYAIDYLNHAIDREQEACAFHAPAPGDVDLPLVGQVHVTPNGPGRAVISAPTTRRSA